MKLTARDPDVQALTVLGTMVLSSSGLAYGDVKKALRALVKRDPLDTVLTTVLGGAWLFYLAEHGKNPKIESYMDALVFISTCMSVGYADSFARTPSGKAIATAVMTLGPALSARVLDDPAPAPAPDEAPAEDSAAQHRALLSKLDRLVTLLEAQKQ